MLKAIVNHIQFRPCLDYQLYEVNPTRVVLCSPYERLEFIDVGDSDKLLCKAYDVKLHHMEIEFLTLEDALFIIDVNDSDMLDAYLIHIAIANQFKTNNYTLGTRRVGVNANNYTQSSKPSIRAID